MVVRVGTGTAVSCHTKLSNGANVTHLQHSDYMIST
jgi:hypothetical protein